MTDDKHDVLIVYDIGIDHRKFNAKDILRLTLYRRMHNNMFGYYSLILCIEVLTLDVDQVRGFVYLHKHNKRLNVTKYI